MDNTTTELDSKLYKVVSISYVVWCSFGLTCVFLGVPGHIFHMLITTKKTNRKDPTSLYFTAIAMSELIYLLGLYNSNIYHLDEKPVFKQYFEFMTRNRTRSCL